MEAMRFETKSSDTTMALQVFQGQGEIYQEPAKVSLKPVESKKVPHFIEANTVEVSMEHLKYETISPVFSKDNEVTISHSQFIETILDAAHSFFHREVIGRPEIRVSHVVKGRRPEAINKAVFELEEVDKTIYYERAAFCIDIPSIYEEVDGNRLNLSIGGVRAFNHENLYGKKVAEKFKVFIGFKNLVCCNLCVSTDGLKSELKALSSHDLYKGVLELFGGYNPVSHLHLMESLNNSFMNEHTFAQLIGKTRLYQFLPANKKKSLPNLEFNDTQISMVARAYYGDRNFSRHPITKELSLWNLHNLFTGANKSSYIDSFLDRAMNATQLTEGINKALHGDNEYRWFLE